MNVRLVFSMLALGMAATLPACSGSSTPADAGRRDGGRDAGVRTPPDIAVTAAPAQGMANQAVAFTATITAGTPPYTSCRWKFDANGQFENGSLNGGTCTGNHTYADNGDYTVVAEVEDNANRIGTRASTYTVGGMTMGMGVDLQVKPGSFQLVSPPTNNRYQPGGEMRVAFIVRNQLLANAGASVARVLIKPSFGGTESTLGEVNVNAIAAQAEQSANATFTLPQGLAIDSYDISIVADANMQVAEENETNNTSRFPGQFAIELAGTGDGGM